MNRRRLNTLGKRKAMRPYALVRPDFRAIVGPCLNLTITSRGLWVRADAELQ